jgi:hypothetical protein
MHRVNLHSYPICLLRCWTRSGAISSLFFENHESSSLLGRGNAPRAKNEAVTLRQINNKTRRDVPRYGYLELSDPAISKNRITQFHPDPCTVPSASVINTVALFIFNFFESLPSFEFLERFYVWFKSVRYPPTRPEHRILAILGDFEDFEAPQS